jgi:hypothetical protein
LSGVTAYLKRITNDTAVYWASPTASADGSNSFGTPIEIKCFWSNSIDLKTEIDRKDVFVQAKVHVVIDLDEQGMLFHGKLTDLTDIQKSNPKKVPRAYEIKKFIKIPSLTNKSQFNRVAII